MASFHLPKPHVHVSNPLDSAKKKIVSELEHFAGTIKNDLKHASQSCVNDIEHKANKLMEDVQHVASNLPEHVNDTIESVLHEAVELATSHAIRKATGVLKACVPKTFSLGIGPVVLSWDDVSLRSEDIITQLSRWEQNPPSTRGQIIKLVKDVMPDTVTVRVGVGVSLIVLQSESLQIDMDMSFDVNNFISMADNLLSDVIH